MGLWRILHVEVTAIARRSTTKTIAIAIPAAAAISELIHILILQELMLVIIISQ
jgi:hypothetical protein